MATRGGAPPDRCVCLSMHQPWASLLVHGIKRIEGRGWASAHRGRLWIAATVQQPSPQQIEELEAFYRSVHAADAGAAPGISADLVFPPAYPTGVLLGCVEVVDVLKAEQVEAWEALPAGVKSEVGSPHCFLCQAPQRLVVPQQMRGQHKLFDLEKKVHKVAQLGLKPAPNSQQFRWDTFGAPPPLPESPETAPRAGAPRAAALQQQAQQAQQQAQQQQPQQQAQQQAAQDPVKRARAVQKKLRQIAAIQEKQAGGAALQEEELSKLAQRAELEAETAALAALI